MSLDIWYLLTEIWIFGYHNADSLRDNMQNKNYSFTDTTSSPGSIDYSTPFHLRLTLVESRPLSGNSALVFPRTPTPLFLGLGFDIFTVDNVSESCQNVP